MNKIFYAIFLVIFLCGCNDNRKTICIEKRDIINECPIISESVNAYRIDVGMDFRMWIPKTGEWVEHPALKNMKCGRRFYRYLWWKK